MGSVEHPVAQVKQIFQPDERTTVDPPARRAPERSHSLPGQVPREHHRRSAQRDRDRQGGHSEASILPAAEEERNGGEN